MGWTRRANPKWYRKASGQRFPSERMLSVTIDQHGSVKRDNWSWCWTGSSRSCQRYTSHLRRIAGKRQIAHELLQYEEEQHEQRLFEESLYEIAREFEEEEYYSPFDDGYPDWDNDWPRDESVDHYNDPYDEDWDDYYYLDDMY